jgi:RNA ligase
MGGKNRIVVDYGDKYCLVLLAVIDTASGIEMSYGNVNYLYSEYFEVVKKYDIKNITNLLDLKTLEEDNKEGFVVKFSNGFRVKVKFAEYVRLHGVLTNVSSLTIWRHLMNGDDFDMLLDKVPDEFYDWLKKTVAILELKYNEIERLALKEFIRIYRWEDLTNRKDFALEALKSVHCAILFKLYENKLYDNIIWKKVRPVFSKPFKNGYAFVE